VANNKLAPGRECHGEVGLIQGVRFSLQNFSEVFDVRDADGLPYVLIGGQAVNYWAERYFSTEPELQKLLPFTSEDIDFKGGRDDVQRIAKQLNLSPVFPRRVEMTALAGAIPFRIGDMKSNIEVVRTVPGVSQSAVESLAIQAEWSGKQIRVLNPISLLVCKLELALTVKQEKRRDVEHLRILVPCVRGFLREFLKQVESGDLPVKGWLGAVNQILKTVSKARGRRASKRFEIDWSETLPSKEIAKSKHEKIVQFQEKQLARVRW
jgi:hypothetical protein